MSVSCDVDQIQILREVLIVDVESSLVALRAKLSCNQQKKGEI